MSHRVSGRLMFLILSVAASWGIAQATTSEGKKPVAATAELSSGVTISLEEAWLGHIPLERFGSGGVDVAGGRKSIFDFNDGKTWKSQDVLLGIRVRIENNTDRAVAYKTVRGMDGTDEPYAALSDGNGKRFALATFSGGLRQREGVNGAAMIQPSTSLIDVVCFDVPPAEATRLTLILPNAAVGGTGWTNIKFDRPVAERVIKTPPIATAPPLAESKIAPAESSSPAERAETPFSQAKRKYERARLAAIFQYVSDLKAAKRAAMLAEDLDQANAIAAELKAVETTPTPGVDDSRLGNSADSTTEANIPAASERTSKLMGTPGSTQGATLPPALTQTDAKRVVFLCDASGTMMSVFDRVRTQVGSGINSLKSDQLFNVVFFQDDQVMTFSKRDLKAASDENKKEALDFIRQTTARGSTDPIPAAKFAFSERPDEMFILTDGFDAVASFDEVIKAFKRFNLGNRTKVNTILIGNSTSQRELIDVLRKIAEDSGGRFSIVSREKI